MFFIKRIAFRICILLFSYVLPTGPRKQYVRLTRFGRLQYKPKFKEVPERSVVNDLDVALSSENDIARVELFNYETLRRIIKQCRKSILEYQI